MGLPMSLVRTREEVLDSIVCGLHEIGYHAALLHRDYDYTDVAGPEHRLQRIPLAAFAVDPPDYRNACIGVAFANGSSGRANVMQHRALGAPLVLEIRPEGVDLWSLGRDSAELRQSIPPTAVESVIARMGELGPREILIAKTGGAVPDAQLSLIDVDLLPALETLVNEKLDTLLRHVLGRIRATAADHGSTLEDEDLFRLLFRFLAAKLLRDRRPDTVWQSKDPREVLRAIEVHYGSEGHHLPPMSAPALEALQAGWDAICDGFFFHNLSAGDLAFIYENTFVTAATRKKYGTHSTPSRIAEYIVRNLPFDELDLRNARILEPCSGHGIFLVSAMRRLRELLPPNLTPTERHDYFRERLIGIEEDAFACEVCLLHLILADYPNPDGWQVYQENVFASNLFGRELERADVVLCNPPFEALGTDERSLYGASHFRKPAELLSRVLRHPPHLLGFVLPQAFREASDYRPLHRDLAEIYESIQLLALPDKVFQHADSEAVLLIAHGRRRKDRETTVRWGAVREQEYAEFSRGTHIPTLVARAVSHWDRSDPAFTLWLPTSQELWRYLANFPQLEDLAEVRRGLQWAPGVPLDDRASDALLPGWWPGYHTSEDTLWPYQLAPPGSINLNPDYIYGGNLDWQHPKVLVNANAKSRGIWRLNAVTDHSRFVVTQSFHVIYSRRADLAPEVLTGLLNSSVANAWVFEREDKRHNKVSTLRRLPVPPVASLDREKLTGCVRELERLLALHKHSPGDGLRANTLIREIDDLVLDAYELPLRLRRLLANMTADQRRPVGPRSPVFEELLPDAERQAELDWQALNERRVLLIHRKHTSGVSQEEDAELGRLREQVGSYIRARFPSRYATNVPHPEEGARGNQAD